MAYTAALLEIANLKSSRLILALDYTLNRKLISILRTIEDYLVGVKIGVPLMIEDAIYVKEIIKKFRNLYFIADLKLADVPHIQFRLIDIISKMGFNAIIAHLFPMSIDRCIDYAHKQRLAVLGVLMMSHEGATLFEENFHRLLDYARNIQIDGLIVGATKPEYIRRCRDILKDVLIFSPGVIRQGAPIGEALRYGADFEIVGRYILHSKDPLQSVLNIIEVERRVLRCRKLF